MKGSGYIYKTSFTPGPWVKMESGNIFTELGAENQEGTRAPSNDGWMIADCDAGGLSLKEVEANAALIASAPNLYDKLEQLILIVGLTAFKHESQRAVLQEAVDEAHEALKAANGESK